MDQFPRINRLPPYIFSVMDQHVRIGLIEEEARILQAVQSIKQFLGSEVALSTQSSMEYTIA
jgi:hypothetical protein